MKKWGMILALITISVYAFCDEKAPWDGIELSQPFKNTWSARIEDNEGGHVIRNVWIESKYLKSKRDITAIMKRSVDERTIREVMAKYKRQFEDLLFVETEDFRLYAVEVESGVIKWVTYFPDKIQYKPTFGSEYIFCTSDEILFATNREYGLLAWRKPLNFPISTSPVPGTANLLFLPSWENRLFALDTETRQMNWQFRTRGNIIGTPVYVGGLIYIPCEDGKIYCIKSNGEPVYEYETNGPLRKSPRVKGGFLYFGSDDNSVYCINRYNGTKMWECRIGRPIRRNPEVIDRNVYVKPAGKGYTAISRETGKILWEIPYTTKIVGFGRKTIYLYAGEYKKKYIVGVDKDSGEILWVFNPRENIESSFDEPLENLYDLGRIFFKNSSPGRLYMLTEKGFYEKITEAQASARADEAGVGVGAAEGEEGVPADGGVAKPDDTTEEDDIEDLLDLGDLE